MQLQNCISGKRKGLQVQHTEIRQPNVWFAVQKAGLSAFGQKNPPLQVRLLRYGNALAKPKRKDDRSAYGG